MPVPIYLISAPQSAARARSERFGDAFEVFDTVAAWGGFDGKEPGILLVDRDTAGEAEILGLAAEVTDAPEEWTFGVIDGDGPENVRSLGFGPSAPLGEVARYARDPEDAKEILLDLRRTLAEIARVRHDVNNPLTAALAEVQLLLFDVVDEESRESLTITQTQLRRIRDMMASTTHLRPPPR